MSDQLWLSVDLGSEQILEVIGSNYFATGMVLCACSTSDKYTANYWKTGSKNAGAFQHLKSLAKKMDDVGAHSASGFIDQWVYYWNPTFQVVASYRFVYGRFFVARFCSPPPKLHKTGTIQKHWNRATKYANTRHVHELGSGIYALVCGPKYLFTMWWGYVGQVFVKKELWGVAKL